LLIINKRHRSRNSFYVIPAVGAGLVLALLPVVLGNYIIKGTRKERPCNRFYTIHIFLISFVTNDFREVIIFLTFFGVLITCQKEDLT